jgi:RES domain-containing protein
VLVGYRVRCERIIDLTAPAVLAACGVDDATLACAWEDLASRGRMPPTWSLAETLIAAGCHGALVPSFAPGTTQAERNLVLWLWSDAPPCQALVIDDFGRLPKDDASWV